MLPVMSQPWLWQCQTSHIERPRCKSDDLHRLSGTKSLTSYYENLTSFAYHFFHFRTPPGLMLGFDAAERNEKFGRIWCQIGKERSSRGKRKRRVFLGSRSKRVKVEGKAS